MANTFSGMEQSTIPNYHFLIPFLSLKLTWNQNIYFHNQEIIKVQQAKEMTVHSMIEILYIFSFQHVFDDGVASTPVKRMNFITSKNASIIKTE